MDKSTLESFILISETRSFSVAAQKQHLTQPAISKRIVNLEQQLNCALLIRNNKNVHLTPQGEIFLHHAKKMLIAINECQIAIQNAQETVTGTLKLGISHHIGLHRLPPFLQTFSAQYPSVHLQLQFITSEEAIALIQENILEIAIITLPNNTPQKTVMQNLWQDPLQIVVSSTHPLAQLQHKKPLSIEHLADYPAILPSFDTFTGQLIEQWFTQQQLKIEHYIETNNLETIRMMTNIGLGWSALPRIMLNSQLQALIFNNNPRFPSRNLGYIYHTSRLMSHAAKAFLQTLQQAPYRKN